jgi:hypothetical protein
LLSMSYADSFNLIPWLFLAVKSHWCDAFNVSCRLFWS